jgi:hypothetical protein
MGEWMFYVEASAATGAFDALGFRAQGGDFVGFGFNQQNAGFVFRFARMFEPGKEVVDNTVHLPADVLQRMKETHPEILEKMANSRPLVYVEGSRERCLASDGMRRELVFDMAGNRLAHPEALDEVTFQDIRSHALAFRRDWLWAPQDAEAGVFGPLADAAEWNTFPLNLKAPRRDDMRRLGGREDGTLERYVHGLDTERLSTEDADEYNLLNLLVEVRHTAQAIFEKWG